MRDPDHNRRQDDGWHIKKTMDVGHILTTFVIAASAFFYIAELDTRITVVEARESDRQRVIDEIRSDIKEIKELLWEMNTSRGDD